MFIYHQKPIAFRGLMLAGCLALLGAGCGGSQNTPAANSAVVSVVAAPAAAPAGLTATAGDAMVTLTWTASSGATGYNVKRSTTTGGPSSQIGAPTSASYTDASLTNGTTYYYVVSAIDSTGESANSAQVSATPVAPAAIPATPTGLSANPGNAQVTLTWSSTNGATSYHVKRATTSGGPYTQVGAPTSTSYDDTSLSNGTTYYYVVSALNGAGESANSAQVSATPVAAGVGTINIAWAVPTQNIDGSAITGAITYTVYQGLGNIVDGPTSPAAVVQSGLTSPSATITGLTSGTLYYLEIETVVSGVSSALSSPVYVTSP